MERFPHEYGDSVPAPWLISDKMPETYHDNRGYMVTAFQRHGLFWTAGSYLVRKNRIAKQNKELLHKVPNEHSKQQSFFHFLLCLRPGISRTLRWINRETGSAECRMDQLYYIQHEQHGRYPHYRGDVLYLSCDDLQDDP